MLSVAKIKWRSLTIICPTASVFATLAIAVFPSKISVALIKKGAAQRSQFVMFGYEPTSSYDSDLVWDSVEEDAWSDS